MHYMIFQSSACSHHATDLFKFHAFCISLTTLAQKHHNCGKWVRSSRIWNRYSRSALSPSKVCHQEFHVVPLLDWCCHWHPGVYQEWHWNLTKWPTWYLTCHEGVNVTVTRQGTYPLHRQLAYCIHHLPCLHFRLTTTKGPVTPVIRSVPTASTCWSSRQ